MYAVVGCSECSSLWVVEGRPDRSQCPTCGRTREHAKRKKFVTTDDPDQAREVRASMLAARSDHDAFEGFDSFAELAERAERAGIDDETYLEGAGVDADAVAAAADRARTGAGGGKSREETVRLALRDLAAPDEAAVVEYARNRGVPPEYTRRVLAKLVRAGEASRSGGTYRLL
jgi:hypothetical protein